MESSGVLARAFPIRPRVPFDWTPIALDRDVKVVSDTFGVGAATSEFGNAGVMRISARNVIQSFGPPMSMRPTQAHGRPSATSSKTPPMCPEQFFVSDDELPKWEFLKGRKSLAGPAKQRVWCTPTTRGPIPFPDPTDTPSRTILTGEGGATPSRFKHLIKTEDGRFRRLTPRELERLNGFPGDWTVGMSDGRRAFMMGNALVVGAVEMVANELITDVIGTDLAATTRVAEAS